jgi:hypothetical protein
MKSRQRLSCIIKPDSTKCVVGDGRGAPGSPTSPLSSTYMRYIAAAFHALRERIASASLVPFAPEYREFIKIQLSRLPTRNEIWRAAMLGMLGGAVAAVTLR